MEINLPKYAVGGSVGGVEMPKGLSGTTNLNDTTNINFTMPTGNTYNMQSSIDTSKALAQEFRRLS